MKDATRRQIDLYPTLEPKTNVDPGVLVLRQTLWGARNGETRIELHVVEADGSQYSVGSGVAYQGTLLSLAAAALELAGKPELASQVVIPNRPSAVRHPSSTALREALGEGTDETKEQED